jgi:hypothetical protein
MCCQQQPKIFERDVIAKCYYGRVQLKRDGTRRRTGGEVKGKVANGVGSQYSPLPRNLVYPALLPLMRTPRLPVVDWTDAPSDLNGLVRFAERQDLFSARVPSHFKRSLVMDWEGATSETFPDNIVIAYQRTGVHTFLQNSRNHILILCSRRVMWSKFLTEDTLTELCVNLTVIWRSLIVACELITHFCIYK